MGPAIGLTAEEARVVGLMKEFGLRFKKSCGYLG